ncbi:MAG: nucleotidyltransferase family protein [Acidobacteria bacterium]|nr:nucleotidyltransferase family protein [Acidobacteriota bacterium]
MLKPAVRGPGLAGLILAGGESRRMGFPKALLSFGGSSFADHLVDLLAAVCAPVIVVVGAHAEAIRAGMRSPSPALVVENPDWRRGQLSSLQCGLRALPPDCRGVVFTPVDHPNIQPATLAALLEAGGRAAVAIPRCQGRRGHPVYISQAVAEEVLALSAPASAREAIRRDPDRICYVDVEDSGILDDVDDPETYSRLTGQLP